MEICDILAANKWNAPVIERVSFIYLALYEQIMLWYKVKINFEQSLFMTLLACLSQLTSCSILKSLLKYDISFT